MTRKIHLESALKGCSVYFDHTQKTKTIHKIKIKPMNNKIKKKTLIIPKTPDKHFQDNYFLLKKLRYRRKNNL